MNKNKVCENRYCQRFYEYEEGPCQFGGEFLESCEVRALFLEDQKNKGLRGQVESMEFCALHDPANCSDRVYIRSLRTHLCTGESQNACHYICVRKITIEPTPSSEG